MFQTTNRPCIDCFPLNRLVICLAPRTSLGTVAAAENPDRSQRSTPPRCQSVTPRQENHTLIWLYSKNKQNGHRFYLDLETNLTYRYGGFLKWE